MIEIKEEKGWCLERLALIDPLLVPHHVAVIPDGNRRWAGARGEGAEFGHLHGAERVHQIVNAAHALGIKVLTFYTFSTENWSRMPEEVEALFTLITETSCSLEPQMLLEGVRLEIIGDLSALPLSLQAQIERTRLATQAGTKMRLVLALNYGGRDEMVRACKRAIKGYLEGEALTEVTLAACMDTAAWGDPQLVIRTSGEMRMSNFLLWQTAYSELYFSSKLWPDFTQNDLLEAVLDYQKRTPRIGK